MLAASAGGIQALGHIFGALPADFRASLAVVLEIGIRGSWRFLAAVLNRSSTLPVQEAVSGDHLQPGHIHLAPGQSALGG